MMVRAPMATPSFQGLHVLALESRRATELAALISALGGRPLVAPALRMRKGKIVSGG